MILVVGGTGDVGGQIARALLERGEQVRVLVRPQSDYSGLEQAGAQPVIGDLKDRASLDDACRGVEAVVTTANTAKRGGEDNVDNVDLNGNVALIDAAQASGVQRFMFVSAMGADPLSPVPFLRAKGVSAQHLRDSGMEHVVLEPDAYMDIWVPVVVGIPLSTGQPVSLVGEANHRHTFVFSA
ncbi:MAG: NAD(P)H-binding protein, partial [Chloroflexi bacterium]|nr:NAD(P)H-binding protein [Chloroflexota bacterium]